MSKKQSNPLPPVSKGKPVKEIEQKETGGSTADAPSKFGLMRL